MLFWSGQENFGSSHSKPHLTFWPLWVLKICVLTLSKSWNVCDKSHSNKMGAALQSLRPVDQLKNSNISKFSCNYWFFWKFMHFDIFITCFAPKMQDIYHIRIWKSEEKSIIFQDFTVLEKLFDIFRFKNVFMDCELFSHLMFSWRIFPYTDMSYPLPSAIRLLVSSKKNFRLPGMLCIYSSNNLIRFLTDNWTFSSYFWKAKQQCRLKSHYKDGCKYKIWRKKRH